MLSKYLVLLILLCSCSLHAQESQEPDPFVSSLTDTQALLPSLVSGSVSIINGDWNESETDFHLVGPEALQLTRKYSAQHTSTARYLPNRERYLDCGQGWDFNHPTSLTIKLPHEDVNGNSKAIEAYFRHACGTKTSQAIILPSHIIDRDTVPLLLHKRHGLTNTTFKEISGKTNFNNTILYLNLHQKNCLAMTGSGEISYFDWKNYDQLPYLGPWMPLYIKKPNGNCVIYKKDGIYATDSTKKKHYNWIQFKHSADGKSLTIKTNDGKWAHYEFAVQYPPEEENIHFVTPEEQRNYSKKRRNARKCYLTKAQFSHKPLQTFKYNSAYRLAYKTEGENYFLKTEYYNLGDNKLDGLGTVCIRTSNDPCKNRVKQQKAPVGRDKTPIVTHRFVYHLDDPEEKKSAGRTNVYDALLRKTTYYYNNHHRLTRQEKFTGVSKSNYQLYCSEQYIWDDEVPAAYRHSKTYQTGTNPFYVPLRRVSPRKKPPIDPSKDEPEKEKSFNLTQYLDEKFQNTNPRGNLIGKCIKDATGQIQWAHFFEYDQKGNITVDQIFGNLTGLNSSSIQLDKKSKRPMTSKTEKYTKYYSYSNDYFNLLMKEVEDNGRGIEYTYLPHSSLVTSKFVLDHDQICLREFYEYDANTSLTKLIKDDGCSRHKDDLTGVTHRRITYFSPKQTQPIGLPEKIDEMYLDLATNQEVLLKRLVQKYSDAGKLLLQEHYDNQGIYCYSLAWDYDNHGNLIMEKDALEHTITKTYDDSDNLKEEIGPREGEKTVYTYDFANRLIKKEIWDGQQTLVTAYEYDYIGNQVAKIDCLGHKTEYVYDEINRLIETKHPETLGENGQLVSTSTSIEYDIFNRPVSVTDEKGNKTLTSYNSYGKPTSVQHADGSCEKCEYALDGSLVKSVARNGSYTIYKRDFLGRVLKQKIYDVNHTEISRESYVYKGMLLQSKVDPENGRTVYEYDGAGRLISTTCEESKTVYEYDSLGRIKTIKEMIDESKAKITDIDYDFLNRVIREKIVDDQGHLLVHTRFEYDARGNKTAVIQKSAAGKSMTRTKYNLLNQPIERQDAEGSVTRISYDYNKRNVCGQRILRIIACDDLGKKKIHELDTKGRLATVIRTNALDLLTAKQDIIYDAVGNKQIVQDFIVEEGKTKERILTKWTYNVVHDPISLVEAVDTPEQRHTALFYNSYGQKERVVKSDGVEVFYTYDALGRLKTQKTSDGSIREEYQYNGNHQVTQVLDQVHQTATLRKYDIKGRLVVEMLGNGLKLGYEYDALDRLVYLELPDHSRVQYVYDALYLREVRRIKEGRIIYTHRYETYDRASNLLSEQAIGLVGKIEHRYDLCKRPLSITAADANWSQSIPSYDRLGRITQYTIKDGNQKKNYKFNYNELDSLCEEAGVFEHTYQVDSLYNRKSIDGKNYQLNALHQVMKADNCQYEYDRNGNLIKKIEGKKVTEYSYDGLNRLTSVVQEGVRTKYQYDAFHRRISKSQKGKVWKYLYQGENEIGCVDENGRLIEFRALGVGIDAEIGAAVAIELADLVLAPIHDHNGNVCCLVDALSGKKVESYSYSAFGEEKILDGEGHEKQESMNPWRYASKRFDVETGLIYFGRRYYDCKIGKWITPDPSQFDDGPNLYAYVYHSPLAYHDAYGLSGQAYRDSCEVALHAHEYADNWSNRSERNVNESHPRIRYFKGFEEQYSKPGNRSDCWASDQMEPCYPPSSIYDLGLANSVDIAIGFINGICNAFEQAKETALKLSKLAGGCNIHGVHNATHGLVADLIECKMGLNYIATEPVTLLHEMWNDFFDKSSDKAKFLMVCHSQGAIHVRNALLDYPKELRDRIYVLAIAPAAYIYPDTCAKVVHYRVSGCRDPIPYHDSEGAKRSADTIVDLNCHTNASWFDHTIASDTYQNVISLKIKRYKEGKGI